VKVSDEVDPSILRFGIDLKRMLIIDVEVKLVDVKVYMMKDILIFISSKPSLVPRKGDQILEGRRLRER
jgi:hypothetical protein